MAGTISLSGAIQLDTAGQPLSGGLLYTFQSGTTTPQSAFQDTALTIAHPNPMTADGSGRLPFFYLADGTIKIRLANAAGVTQLTADTLLVVGPSGGGGGGASVDPTTVFGTGDIKKHYGTGSLTGWVRCNKRTIGSATSGALELANASAQALFEHLWIKDPNLPVSGGRGASANADWLANKTIETPDGRGRGFSGLDDMGNSAAGRLTSSFFGSSGIVLGQTGGGESHTLTIAQLPVVTPAGTVGITDTGHTHAGSTVALESVLAGAPSGTATRSGGSTALTISTATTGIAAAFTGTSFGSGNGHSTVPPTMLVTYYIKL